MTWKRTWLIVASKEDFLHECDTSDKPNTSQTMRLARQWIWQCQDHTICKSNYSPRREEWFFPSRLLDVGKDGGSTVRLVGLDTYRRGGTRYAALSHCWGNKTPHGCLLLGTLDLMRKSIAIDGLPKNFQDAIEIARGIDVRFLWIDALCIIQDSAEDWQREAASMGSIYANAVCMISATGSPDCEGGCFLRRQRPSKVTECVLGIKGDRAQVARPTGEVQNMTMDELFDRFVEKAPLTKRGWTFQERVLAQRILHFCDGLVLFECNTLRASEFHPDGIDHIVKANLRTDGSLRGPDEREDLFGPSREREYIPREPPKQPLYEPIEFIHVPGPVGGMMIPRTGMFRDYTPMVRNPKYRSAEFIWAQYVGTAALAGMRGEFQLLLTLTGSAVEKQVGFHQSWFEIVGQYSERSLTKVSDKMFALVGVADFIERSSARKFVAGMWVDCLAVNLLWNVKAPAAAARLPLDVPSWSWLSVSGGVETALQLDYNEYMDPGKLLIHPLISIAHIQATAEQGKWVSNAKLDIRGRVCDFSDLHPHVILDVSAVVPSMFGPDAYLPTLESHGSFAAENKGYQIHGLVIRRISVHFNEFERVGYFSLSAPDKSAKCFQILHSQPQTHIILV